MKIGNLKAAACVALAASAATTFADHNFGHATDLGRVTDEENEGWTPAGREFVGEFEDVEGTDYEYLRFELEAAGPIRVWTTGGLSPYIRIYDSDLIRITERGEWHQISVESGYHYIEVYSSTPGPYRLHVAGGGIGHDDFANVQEFATLVTSTISTLANPAPPVEIGRIDYGGDRDWFQFDVPLGSPTWIRIWTSGAINTVGSLLDSEEIELERSYDDDSDGDNFLIARALDPGTYRVAVDGRYSSVMGPYRLHVTKGDDHGNLFQTASRAELHSETSASLDYASDIDFFWFQASTRGSVEIRSSGSTNTSAVLYDSYEIELERNSSSGDGRNFLIERTLEPGTYYVAVIGEYSYTTGPYTLHLSGEASGVVSVPLVPAHANTLGQQGFVRIINHSGKEIEEVEVTAYDDTGRAAGSFTLANLAPWSTAHFNSEDLELGNPAKGINNGVGNGMGNWYLEVAPSEPEVEVLSYIRTRDGFLTSMHAQAPSYGREHRVAVFNPGSNRRQASRLRLIHPKCPQIEQSDCSRANITIFGVDDRGQRSPDVQFSLGSGAACDVTAAQLEGLDLGPMCLGGNLGDGNSLGDGTGKWQLFVSADQPIHVMSLLQSATGHLTNLSTPTSRQIFSAPTSPQTDNQ